MASDASVPVVLTVNGAPVNETVSVTESLLELLRTRVGLTGAKQACGSGECGACTVLVGDKAWLSCVTPAWRVDGAEVTTAEGVAARESGALLQAFGIEGALQCGFCTPGQYVRAYSLLYSPVDTDLAAAMSGNICRCTGYRSILRALRRARETSTEAAECPAE